jgi:DNA-binding response OmpR family regulator
VQDIRILLAEDDPGWQTTLSSVLVQQGYVVHIAPDYASAYDQFVSVAFDLIIVDLSLGPDSGNRDGVSLLEDAFRKGVPAIVVTGFGTPDMVKKANLFGVMRIMHKRAFSIEDFKHAISEVVSLAISKPTPPTPQQTKEVGLLLRKLASGEFIP